MYLKRLPFHVNICIWHFSRTEQWAIGGYGLAQGLYLSNVESVENVDLLIASPL